LAYFFGAFFVFVVFACYFAEVVVGGAFFCFVGFYGCAFCLVFFGPFGDVHGGSITNIGNMFFKCFVFLGFVLGLFLFFR